MVQLSPSRIRRLDETLSSLIERRSRCEDPVEVIQTMESIDHLLDMRLVLMRDEKTR